MNNKRDIPGYPIAYRDTKGNYDNPPPVNDILCDLNCPLSRWCQENIGGHYYIYNGYTGRYEEFTCPDCRNVNKKALGGFKN